MDSHNRHQLVNELLGSAHLFVSAVSGVMEQQLLTEIAGKQLSISQLKILKLLDLTEAHNVGDVAAFLGVSDAAASKSVDRLVRRKYLRRTEGRTDRRSSDLSLAAAGRSVLKRYETAKDRKLAAMFGNLDTDELLANRRISGAFDQGDCPRQRQSRRDLFAVRNLPQQEAVSGAGGRKARMPLPAPQDETTSEKRCNAN